MSDRGSVGDDRPSEAVLDELLRMFHADDLTRGADIDLESPEVEELLSGSTPRPRPKTPSDELESSEPRVSDSDPDHEPDQRAYRFGLRDVDDAPSTGEGSASDESQSSEAKPSETNITSSEAKPSETDVIVIEEDDLPDVSYLDEDDADGADVDGDGEAAGVVTERERVFIDDDAKLEEAVGSAEAARATGIEPKLRERRAAVQKAHGRKRLRWVVAGVVVLAMLIAGLAVLGSSLFAIEDVSVSNAVYSREELDPIIDDLRGEPTLRADTGGFEERIERIPWVEEARVQAKFPDSASIEVRERVPAATFQGDDGRYRVIDAEGRVLDVVDGQPVEFMLVRSVNPPSPEAGEFTPSGFVSAAAMALALTPSVRPITEVIVVANDGSDVRLQLTGGTEVRLGSGDDLVDKLARLETVIDIGSEPLPARIDVSTDAVTVQETASG